MERHFSLRFTFLFNVHINKSYNTIIKDTKWFEFTNQHFDDSGSVVNWTSLPTGQELLAISQHNDPIVAFVTKHTSDFQISYYFDNQYLPESRRIVSYNMPLDTSETEAVVSYDDGSYMIFIDDHRTGGHCFLRQSKRSVLFSSIS